MRHVHEIKDKDGKVIRRRVMTETGPGMTQQSHKAETDMNYIMADYEKTRIAKHVKQYEGRYDDVEPFELQNALTVVKESKEMFDTLPLSIRKLCDNNPVKFLEFVQNPENKGFLEQHKMLKGLDGLDSDGKPLTTEQTKTKAVTEEKTTPAKQDVKNEKPPKEA